MSDQQSPAPKSTDQQATQVALGDHETRDGHYRSKEVCEHIARDSVTPSDDPYDKASKAAQNPIEIAGTRVGGPYTEAAGLPAILSSTRYGLREMGVARTVRTWLEINKENGFDCQSCAWPSPDPGKRKLFEFCENGAKSLADEATKKVITAKFFAEHSVTELAGQSDYWLNKQGRLTEPMVLRPGASHYVPISWDEAFTFIASELNRLASPDEAVFYTSGKTTNEPAYLLQLFARQFGTNNLPDCSNMCHESSGVALVDTLGIGKGTVTLQDFEKCDLIMIFGNNPGTNHPRMLTSLEEAKRNGARMIAVNPMPETGLLRVVNPNPQDYPNMLKFPFAILGRGAELADLHLPVRINGDVAAVKGILKHLLEEGKAGQPSGIDRNFIKEFTIGFEDLERDIAGTSWDDIVEGSGLSEEAIRHAGAMVASSKRMICCWCVGVTQHRNGVDNVLSIVNLLLAGGHMGRPGAGGCCVRGHSNVQGDRTMGIWERPPKPFLEALGREFKFTPPEKWGYDTVESMKAMHQGKVKVFFAISGNFVSNVPDSAFIAHAMERCRLTVHVSTKLNRSHLVTGQQALILPCLGRSERDVQDGVEQYLTVEDSMGIIGRSQGRLKPASPQLKSDVEIIARLAEATFGKRSAVDWARFRLDYRTIRESIGRVIPGFTNFDKRLAEEKAFYLPNAARERIFKTPSSKAKFSVCPIARHELAAGEYLLTTVRTHDQFNSTIYGLNDRYRGVYGGRRVILVNPDDMQTAGLTTGQLVDIHSHFDGQVRKAPQFAVTPYPIARRCAAAYYPETNVLVAVDSVAERSNQPASKSIRITLHPSAKGMAEGYSAPARAIEKSLGRPDPVGASCF